MSSEAPPQEGAATAAPAAAPAQGEKPAQVNIGERASERSELERAAVDCMACVLVDRSRDGCGEGEDGLVAWHGPWSSVCVWGGAASASM